MTDEELRFERRGDILILTLNRPAARNALSLSLRQKLSSAFIAADRDVTLRVVVIAGSDGIFSAGGDIKEFRSLSVSSEAARESQLVWQMMPALTIPIVAAVEGFALGGGAELALHADIIVASESAIFAFPEVTLGILPGNGGTQRFPRLVGKTVAMRYLLTGERFTALQALGMGMVSEVAPAGSALDKAVAIATRIAAMPPLAVRQIKDVVLNGADVPLHVALSFERLGYASLQKTEDHAEASRAFAEKRAPRFDGR